MGLFSKKREEGLIESYRIEYLGGHPDYPKRRRLGDIDFVVLEDCFELRPTSTSSKWFNGYAIPYENVLEVQTPQWDAQPTDDWAAANFNVKYLDVGGELVLLRLKMYGFWYPTSMKKCQELQDRLRTHHIKEKFRSVSNDTNLVQQKTDDIPAQIEKLATLCKKGIISKKEFADKKKDLLSRM